MALPDINFGTGPASLNDVGRLSYNGLTFSPLFLTKVSASIVKDEANRTTKLVEYTITADGYVTLSNGQTTISPTMTDMRTRLTQQGGKLTYQGRGCDFDINALPAVFLGVNRGGGINDVAWGPVPKLIEFQPLGGGLSAKVQWQVTFRIPEVTAKNAGAGLANTPILQFSYDTSLTYGEDYYSSMTVKGILEIPLGRAIGPNGPLTTTVDNIRNIIDARIMKGIDLTRFHVTNRQFNVSKDKRTMEWTITIQETPYMEMPQMCTLARGSYTVAPAHSGYGLCNWMCTLRATYTVRADAPRRNAWTAFLALLRLRMACANVPGQEPLKVADKVINRLKAELSIPKVFIATFFGGRQKLIDNAVNKALNEAVRETTRALLMHFSFDEGLYLDSKTITFTATWRLMTTFNNILLASGLWKKVPETDGQGGNLWAISMRDVSGSESWLANKLDPSLDLVIDFGS